MRATAQLELEDRAGRNLRAGRPVKCVSRNGANEKLGTVANELDAILSRPLNHKLRLTGIIDIASPGATHEELRFVVACLEEFVAGKMVARTDEQIAVLLFGEIQKQQGVVHVKRLYRALNCKSSHFYGLAKGRWRVLRLAEQSKQRRGPGGSGVVPWSEIVRFIGERRKA